MQRSFLSPKIIKFVIVSAICFLLIFLNPKGIFDPVRGVFLAAAYPFQKTFYLLSRNISEFFSFLSSISSMRDENERLIKENNALIAEVVNLRELKNENDVFRKQLELVPKDKFDLESSLVIGQDPQGLGNWIVIDKGSADGVSSGMPVIVSDGILIGKISEVNSGSSKINLLTDSNSAVNVSDLETDARGLVRGAFGLGLLLDMVAQTDILNKGDAIVTSGLGGEFPKGLLIGNVQEVRDSPDKLFQQAIIAPRVKYQSLELVFIIKN